MDRRFLSVFPSFPLTYQHFSLLLPSFPSLSYSTTLSLCHSFNLQVLNHLSEFDPASNRSFYQYCVPHINQFFVCLLLDPDYIACDKHDQNILLWVCLLHDIKKKIDDGGMKDPGHPFRSAAAVVRYMERWGWISGDGERLAREIEGAIVSKKEYDVHDNGKLGGIVEGIMSVAGVEWRQTGYADSVRVMEIEDKSRLFEVEILLLTLLHQLLTTLRIFPSFAPLKDSEIGVYFSKRLLRLMKIVAMCDSESYTLKNDQTAGEKNRREISSMMSRYESLLSL